MNNKSKKELTILLVGCGNWGKNILRDLKNLDCKVVVLTKSEESYTNAKDGEADQIVEAIEEAGEIDGAVVAVNSMAHYEVINEILDVYPSLPIYTEKPLCVTAEDAFILFQKAKENLFVMHKWRYHQGILQLAKIANEKSLGKIKGIKLRRNGWGVPHKDVDCIWILLPHDLSITLELLGYIPEAKFAKFDKTINGIHGMTGFLGDEKHWVSFEVSERSAVVEREITVYFEDGIAQLTDSLKNNVEIYKTTKDNLNASPDPKIIEFENTMPLYAELKSFTNFIKGKEASPKSSVFEGYQVVKRIQQLRDLAEANIFD